ncbi:cupredoxin domain-containing protein [Halobacillus yeomjeoni]|uniref:Cupredoxin domain-containing protein n=1 Tax=Halobacillus yeomjeoni TaxID=311194 RepID=A0A931HVR4_9BACI|nr:cupredoxin domain-containing protein [Halobacillus yeomjeoni]MBH0230378.1 cupredoxin domain-containing protein [Halobacillus yeomjeoni]MCA0984758.1 cupredoxin domain-containing protein [Halobacillus yeomjeoni]
MRVDAWIISAKKVGWIFGAVCLALMAYFIGSYFWTAAVATSTESLISKDPRKIHLVTGEFKAETVEGDSIESYRWDPSTIFVEEGEPIQLSIYGVNGKEHPFEIEGTDIQGVVKQGKETVIDVKFEKEGIYQLVCHTHGSIQDEGPMIAYFVVD